MRFHGRVQVTRPATGFRIRLNPSSGGDELKSMLGEMRPVRGLAEHLSLLRNRGNPGRIQSTQTLLERLLLCPLRPHLTKMGPRHEPLQTTDAPITVGVDYLQEIVSAYFK